MTVSLRTPLSRARGHGSAKAGLGHFIEQRVSATALLFLAPWFAASAFLVFPNGYEATVNWLNHPFNAIAMILFLLAALFHMRLGLQTIIEDYVTGPGARILLLIASSLVCIAAAAAGIWAVAHVNFGG
jgi:succinate dehydrogenase / fumarate reductase, membrane anchor subunit